MNGGNYMESKAGETRMKTKKLLITVADMCKLITFQHKNIKMLDFLATDPLIRHVQLTIIWHTHNLRVCAYVYSIELHSPAHASSPLSSSATSS